MESVQGLALWAPEQGALVPTGAPRSTAGTEYVRIALLNNMPDTALEDSESQFYSLLSAASGDFTVRVQLFSLPNVPRGDRARRRLDAHYFSADSLWNQQFDAVIITGTEPCGPDLRKEQYWPALAQSMEWAQENTISAVLSCLAAHASVFHSDGIQRHPLPEKRFGVFDFVTAARHALTSGAGASLRCPHSRWNEVRATELAAAGYTILSQSPDAGVDIFVKKKRKSLFVHFQGHPEYGVLTLWKEYRRDTRSFLKGTRDRHPPLPLGYFNAAATSILDQFRNQALRNRSVGLMPQFPEAAVTRALQHTWHSSATRIYRNWLQHVLSNKSAMRPLSMAAGPLAEPSDRRMTNGDQAPEAKLPTRP